MAACRLELLQSLYMYCTVVVLLIVKVKLDELMLLLACCNEWNVDVVFVILHFLLVKLEIAVSALNCFHFLPANYSAK